ncbi:MAG: bifunctional adenosylcobinamide kinase/adenosylcobinamide-phosphate guanylyltransferase [Ruminococcus sp.]|nr:bifunctional adenosylcobinamide kinase/adenosylcobinamide-phosphate guanylyltransferase [Ruminococcus sp.]
MEMIIGGAYQGKENYARRSFPDITWKKGSELTDEELYQADGVLGFHEYIRKSLKEGRDLTDLARKLLEKNPDVILVGEEVGYGIVPADAFERQYREAVGRICTALAEGSSKVTRVVCGIGTVLKDA